MAYPGRNSWPLTRLSPWYPGQMGVPGSDVDRGIREMSRGIVLYVDNGHPDCSDTHDGTDPEHPLQTIDAAVQKTTLTTGSIIRVFPGTYTESVITPDYATGPNYVTIEGCGDSMYTPAWQSSAAALPCLDLRGVGWRVRGFRFYGPTQEACIQLRHTDSGANDIAIRTIIEECLFDGLTTGRYGIATHGCYDVWVINCTFQLFHNAVAGGAIAFWLQTSPLAIPYRQHIIGCLFWDNDNHVICPMNGSEVADCVFQPVGYAYAATQTLQTSLAGNPGDDNIVRFNVMAGDYSIAGGYRPGAADSWINNMAEDVAEAEVGTDNGFTIARPT